MGIIELIVLLIVLGLIFYCIGMIPMAEPFPTIIKVIAVVIGILLILQFFGVSTGYNLHL